MCQLGGIKFQTFSDKIGYLSRDLKVEKLLWSSLTREQSCRQVTSQTLQTVDHRDDPYPVQEKIKTFCLNCLNHRGVHKDKNVLHDLETINNSSTFNEFRMSMLKMLSNMPETFCCFSPFSFKLQASNCMQNDRMVKAELFCQKLLSIQSTMRSRRSKTWFVGYKFNILYDLFKHSFESIRAKGTELGRKTFFVVNLTYS